MEYYHLPWVPPGLVKVSPLKNHHRWQGAGMYVGFCTSPIAANTDDGGWEGLPPPPSPDESEWTSARVARGERWDERAVRLGVPEHGGERAAEPHVPDARPPECRGSHAGDDVFARAPGCDRRLGRRDRQ